MAPNSRVGMTIVVLWVLFDTHELVIRSAYGL
jgi:hypothetical protein